MSLSGLTRGIVGWGFLKVLSFCCNSLFCPLFFIPRGLSCSIPWVWLLSLGCWRFCHCLCSLCSDLCAATWVALLVHCLCGSTATSDDIDTLVSRNTPLDAITVGCSCYIFELNRSINCKQIISGLCRYCIQWAISSIPVWCHTVSWIKCINISCRFPTQGQHRPVSSTARYVSTAIDQCFPNFFFLADRVWLRKITTDIHILAHINMELPHDRHPNPKICISELTLDGYQHIPLAYVTMQCMIWH